jgi:hypothetical protein
VHLLGTGLLLFLETFRTSIVQLFRLSLLLLLIIHCSDTANSINYFRTLLVTCYLFLFFYTSKQSIELFYKSEFLAIFRQILLWDKFHSFKNASELFFLLKHFNSKLSLLFSLVMKLRRNLSPAQRVVLLLFPSSKQTY